MVGDGGEWKDRRTLKMCQLLRPFQRFAGGVFFCVHPGPDIFSFQMVSASKKPNAKFGPFLCFENSHFFIHRPLELVMGGMQTPVHKTRKNRCKLPKAGSGFLLLS